MVPGEGYRRTAASTAAHVNWRQAELTEGYARKARECDAAVPDDYTPFADKLASYGEEGRVLGPTVGSWCETSSDFDLLVELIAHVLADKETSVERVAHLAPPVLSCLLTLDTSVLNSVVLSCLVY